MALLAGIILLVVLLLAGGYFITWKIFPYIDDVNQYKLFATNNTIWWTSINSVLLNAPKVIAAATAIKLVKHWYMKQKEKEKVEREKLITDLQLLKAQIRPDFLFSSLELIYNYAKAKSLLAQELLLKFSDLLSYLLYECNDAKVLLEKELCMMKEYMFMDKLRFGQNMEMEIDIKGNVSNKLISPLLLLPFIENSFGQCNCYSGQSWINLELTIEDNMLIMKLMNGIDIDNPRLGIISDEIINVQKRLQLLYPENHELKMYIEQEIAMTLLKINLGEKIDLQPTVQAVSFNDSKSILKYALN